MTDTNTIEIRPVAGRIGAEIGGVRLSGDLAPAVIERIRNALLKHKVAFFRDQHHLDDAGHEAFAAALDSPFKHPTGQTLAETAYTNAVSSDHGIRTNVWHTDVTFTEAYPWFSILRALVIPQSGGDTVWANTVAAYEHLPKALKSIVENLWAVHTNDYDYGAGEADHDTAGTEYIQRHFSSTVYETEHPIVRVHPETGERSLVFGHFVKRIQGLSSHDSDRLFRTLQDHIIKIENTVRWRWREGDVAIWDNRSTQHYGVADYGDQRRVLHRVTTGSDIPVSIDGRHSRSLTSRPGRLAAA